jgi:hypothetical protein
MEHYSVKKIKKLLICKSEHSGFYPEWEKWFHIIRLYLYNIFEITKSFEMVDTLVVARKKV